MKIINAAADAYQQGQDAYNRGGAFDSYIENFKLPPNVTIAESAELMKAWRSGWEEAMADDAREAGEDCY